MFGKKIITEKLSKLHSLFMNRTYSTYKLTLSTCLGIYIAFCPFVGFHTALVFLFGWLFALYTPIILAVSMFINNPWTMIPVYYAGHVFGEYLFDIFSIVDTEYMPIWLHKFNLYLDTQFGFKTFSLGAFFVGGNILGVLISIGSYPIVNYIIKGIKKKKKQIYENNSTE